MNFLRRDDLYDKEKPFQLRYEAEKGTPTTNFRLEKQESVKISSIRGRERDLSFETNGFTVLKLDKEIPYDSFSNPEGIRGYLDEVAQRLKLRLGATKVQVYQYVVSPRLCKLLVKKDGSRDEDSKARSRFPYQRGWKGVRIRSAINNRSYRSVHSCL